LRTGIEKLQLRSLRCCWLNGVDEKLAVTFAMFIAKTQKKIFPQAAIELESRAEAIRQSKGSVIRGDDVRIRRGCLQDGDPIGSECGDDLRGSVWEGGNV